MNRHAPRAQKRTTMTNVETTNKPADLGAQTPHHARLKRPSKKGTTKKKGAATAKQTANSAKPKKAAPPVESKGATILRLVGRPKGASLHEIMAATGWQAHSVRGFISIAGKKQRIESTKNNAGERLYRLVKRTAKATGRSARGKGK
jgi:hypothetical protein